MHKNKTNPKHFINQETYFKRTSTIGKIDESMLSELELKQREVGHNFKFDMNKNSLTTLDYQNQSLKLVQMAK